ncbi:unnamed protein product [Gongylonema pulchrum]|uniref:Prothymosin alpha-like n=1 Tax=Gongylonema pulchrum TaxID=637853 RepID=A0A183DKU5_9BILA|nr:unnamed protein product [Gongylonema pulchrum]
MAVICVHEKAVNSPRSSMVKPSRSRHTSRVNGGAEKKELQLVDEVGGNDGSDEPEAMETDCIVLSEEVAGDDEKEVKKEAETSQEAEHAAASKAKTASKEMAAGAASAAAGDEKK